MLDIPMPEEDEMREDEFDGYDDEDDDARDSNGDGSEREATNSNDSEDGPFIPAFDCSTGCTEDMIDASPLQFFQ